MWRAADTIVLAGLVAAPVGAQDQRAVGEPDAGFWLDGVIPIDLSERDVAQAFAVGPDGSIA